MDFMALAQQCAPDVHPATMAAIVRTESGYNPFAIGVVGGRLERQPRNLAEAAATARMLLGNGWNASFGLGQVNKVNLAPLGLDLTSVFDPCRNLQAAAAIFGDNYRRARPKAADDQQALRLALSEYYSGDYATGFRHGYVQKVVDNVAKPIPVVPAAPRQAAPSSVPSSAPALAAKGRTAAAAVATPAGGTAGAARQPSSAAQAFVFGDGGTSSGVDGEGVLVFNPQQRPGIPGAK